MNNLVYMHKMRGGMVKFGALSHIPKTIQTNFNNIQKQFRNNVIGYGTPAVKKSGGAIYNLPACKKSSKKSSKKASKSVKNKGGAVKKHSKKSVKKIKTLQFKY